MSDDFYPYNASEVVSRATKALEEINKYEKLNLYYLRGIQIDLRLAALHLNLLADMIQNIVSEAKK